MRGRRLSPAPLSCALAGHVAIWEGGTGCMNSDQGLVWGATVLIIGLSDTRYGALAGG